MTLNSLTVMATEINLSPSWNTFWDAISAPAGKLVTLASIIGVALIAFAIVKWAWDRRRGGGGNSSALMGALLIGVILSAPDGVIPIVLNLFDMIANAVIGLWFSAKG